MPSFPPTHRFADPRAAAVQPPRGESNFGRKPMHGPYSARAGMHATMSQQLEGGQRERPLADEIGKDILRRAGPDGRTVRARKLLTEAECAMVERMEASAGTPVFVRFSLRDTSFEARLDGHVPAGAVAQRSPAGLVTGQAIVGG